MVLPLPQRVSGYGHKYPGLFTGHDLGRVESGQVMTQVESGRVRLTRVESGGVRTRPGSSRVGSAHDLGRVGSGCVRCLTGWVGSDQEVFESHGPGRVTLTPIPPAREGPI